MKSGNREDLRWVLDRQKQNNSAIRKQARRYILAILSASIVLIGIWYSNDGLLPSKETMATSLARYGILWQIDLLSPISADAFVESFSLFSTLYSGLGLGFLTISISVAYLIEQSSSCQPVGNVGSYITEEEDTVKEWIEDNDELIEQNEELRLVSMKIGKIGIILTILGLLLDSLLSVNIIIYILMLFYTTYYCIMKFTKHEYLKRTFLRKFICPMIIFLLLLSPLRFYQELSNYSLSQDIVVIYLIICAIPSMYYVRGDVFKYMGLISEYIAR